MSPHSKSSTHEYIVRGAQPQRPETLLRAHNVSPGIWDIFRGKKVLARVTRPAGSKRITLDSGHCNLEAAADAIFILELETKQAQAQALKVTPPTLTRPKSERVIKTPQVIVTLDPQGNLQAELPAGPGARRVISLRHDAEQSLKRILQQQLEGNIAIGQDGSPTRHQVWHWESHQEFPDARCAHCQAEGRIRGTSKRTQRHTIISKSKDVEIRRLAAVTKRKRGQAITVSTNTLTAEDLGL